jgi:hypothetical protein
MGLDRARRIWEAILKAVAVVNTQGEHWSEVAQILKLVYFKASISFAIWGLASKLNTPNCQKQLLLNSSLA